MQRCLSTSHFEVLAGGRLPKENQNAPATKVDSRSRSVHKAQVDGFFDGSPSSVSMLGATATTHRTAGAPSNALCSQILCIRVCRAAHNHLLCISSCLLPQRTCFAGSGKMATATAICCPGIVLVARMTRSRTSKHRWTEWAEAEMFAIER